MVATVRKTLVYDTEVDKDIDRWLNSIKVREKSKYIRVAIRTYKQSGVDHVFESGVNAENTKRISYTYDDIEDKDIQVWLDEVPQRSQSDFVRKAIRFYLNQNTGALPKRAKVRTSDTYFESEGNSSVNEFKGHVVENNDNQDDNENAFINLDDDFLNNIGK